VQTLEMLEKKEKLLGKKAAAEVEKAKQFTQSKNRNGEAPICSLFRFY
jgi:charged multivesicular body protein 4